jgi:hypothetical protein
MRSWSILSAGIFLITFGFITIISIINPVLIPIGSVLPLTIVIFGFWLMVLALIRKASRITAYETPPLMILGWGIVLISIGMIWLYPSSWILILAALIIVVGLIAIIYNFIKKT